ncbi:hypothetical protein HKBW3S09_01659, partial [Candidatus Hakubella thermalkaliphila]
MEEHLAPTVWDADVIRIVREKFGGY